MANEAWVSALNRYAERLHAHAGEEHHVVSALGAWILVALCSPLADAGAGSELAGVLGVDPTEAAKFAAELLGEPHPLVAAGAGLWTAPIAESSAVQRWRSGLPAAVGTGPIPTQAALDAWAAERTLGLIEHFPLTVTPDLVLLLATALATKVSWEVPFDVVDAAELGPSPWANDLQRVLHSPRLDHRHRQYLAQTDRAGLVGVHLTGARGGLLVGSVIAQDDSVPAVDVLSAALAIVSAEAHEAQSVPNCSLFDLPLGEQGAWSISEEEWETESPDGREESVMSVLPAWSADTTVDLDHQELGYPAAARAVKTAIGIEGLTYEAKQTTVARYSAVGFEAAAITHLAMRSSKPRTCPGLKRTANLRFGHPYAVVAAACDNHRADPDQAVPSCWLGLPVFSAWISEPSEA